MAVERLASAAAGNAPMAAARLGGLLTPEMIEPGLTVRYLW
jgi:hypothetical protein